MGNKFVDKWVNNYEPLVDYFDIFQSKLEKKYGKRIKNSIVLSLLKLSIMIKMCYDEDFKINMQNKRKCLEEENTEYEDKQTYLVKISKIKKQKEREIKELDKIINNKDLLIQEYEARNEKLPLEKKIFSIRVLKNNLLKERNDLLGEINKYNKLMNPRFFLQNKKIVEQKLKYIDDYEQMDLNKEILKQLIALQKNIIKCIDIDVKMSKDKASLIECLYKYRYYNFLVFNKDTCIYEVKELKKSLKKLTKDIIDIAIEMKVIIKIFSDDTLNYNITERLLLSKIVSLQDINIKISKEKDSFYLTIYDEQIEESKIKLEKINKEDIKIKTNKNTKLFI